MHKARRDPDNLKARPEIGAEQGQRRGGMCRRQRTAPCPTCKRRYHFYSHHPCHMKKVPRGRVHDSSDPDLPISAA